MLLKILPGSLLNKDDSKDGEKLEKNGFDFPTRLRPTTFIPNYYDSDNLSVRIL